MMPVKGAGAHTVTILMYHSVGTIANAGIHARNIVSVGNFCRQMRYLAAHCHVISLDRYVTHVLSGEPLPADSVVITFDDGYKDNYQQAYPILAQLGLPATFFLATAYIGTGAIKWEDRLSWMVRAGAHSELRASIAGLRIERRYSLQDQAARMRAVDDLVGLLHRVEEGERQRVLEAITGAMGVADRPHPSDMMLSWDEARAMAKTPGISFGSHGVTHCRLSRLSAEALRAEIADSKSRIETELQQPVTLFSYPYGGEGDVDERSRRCIQANGFRCALTTTYGRNRLHSDLYQLRRVGAANRGELGFRLGTWLRASAAGEAMKAIYNSMPAGSR